MSKKNNKGTKRRLRAHDLEKEREEQQKKQDKAAKKAASLAAKGVEKPTKKNKTYRLRKGVRVAGIVVKDSESKAKARKILQAAGVSLGMGMDVDNPTAAEARAAAKKKLIKTSGGLSLKPQKMKKVRAVVASKPVPRSQPAGAGASGQGPSTMDVE